MDIHCELGFICSNLFATQDTRAVCLPGPLLQVVAVDRPCELAMQLAQLKKWSIFTVCLLERDKGRIHQTDQFRPGEGPEKGLSICEEAATYSCSPPLEELDDRPDDTREPIGFSAIRSHKRNSSPV
jgi:hypothetical protein